MSTSIPGRTTATVLHELLSSIHGDAIAQSVLKAFDLEPGNPRELTQDEIDKAHRAAEASRMALSALNQGSRLLLLSQGRAPDKKQTGTRLFDECALAVGIDPSSLSAAVRQQVQAEFDRRMASASASGRQAVDGNAAGLLMQQAIRHVVR